MSKTRSESVRSRMKELLSELDYDFSQFTLEGFARWLGARRGRKIVFQEKTMHSPNSHGAWVSGEDLEFVFCERDTWSVHKAHNFLHELSHIICGHSTVKLSRDTPRVDIEAILLRSLHSKEEDEEAEVLTELIQQEILRHKRWRELVAVSAMNRTLASYLDAVEV